MYIENSIFNQKPRRLRSVLNSSKCLSTVNRLNDTFVCIVFSEHNDFARFDFNEHNEFVSFLKSTMALFDLIYVIGTHRYKRLIRMF